MEWIEAHVALVGIVVAFVGYSGKQFYELQANRAKVVTYTVAELLQLLASGPDDDGKTPTATWLCQPRTPLVAPFIKPEAVLEATPSPRIHHGLLMVHYYFDVLKQLDAQLDRIEDAVLAGHATPDQIVAAANLRVQRCYFGGRLSYTVARTATYLLSTEENGLCFLGAQQKNEQFVKDLHHLTVVEVGQRAQAFVGYVQADTPDPVKADADALALIVEMTT